MRNAVPKAAGRFSLTAAGWYREGCCGLGDPGGEARSGRNPADQAMDCDGQKKGYDLELTRAVSRRVEVPVIASGGAGALEHFYDAFTEGCADAVLAASLFHFGEITVPQLKKYLESKHIPVRK